MHTCVCMRRESKRQKTEGQTDNVSVVITLTGICVGEVHQRTSDGREHGPDGRSEGQPG